MFHFHTYIRDEQFDLLHDELPYGLEYLMGEQMRRARAILKNRNNDEIVYAIESLDWMLKEGSEHLFVETMEALKTQDGVTTDRIKALNALMQNIELENQPSFPNATWPEYFAVLALAYIAEALHPENWAPSNVSPSDTHITEQTQILNLFHSVVPHWPIEAMDAVCYAERLQSEARIIQDGNDTPKKLGRKGGIIRGSKFNALHDKVIAIYLEKHQTRSNRDAAKRIVKKLSKDDLETLSTGEPNLTFERWIGQYKNQLKGS